MPKTTTADPEVARTCADKALTLIEMSEFSEALDNLKSLDQLDERLDWNQFVIDVCDHVGEDAMGDPEAIAHLNAVNIAADKMIQAHPRSEMAEVDFTNPGQVAGAVHAQVEDLDPLDAIAVLDEVRGELLDRYTKTVLSAHFAAPADDGPVRGLLDLLRESGLTVEAQ